MASALMAETAAWANAPEINAVGHLIKRRICVYIENGWQITISPGMSEYGYTDGPPLLAILWTNPDDTAADQGAYSMWPPQQLRLSQHRQ